VPRKPSIDWGEIERRMAEPGYTLDALEKRPG
jgi:hypothetical protein